jgi:hypothetical protein
VLASIDLVLQNELQEVLVREFGFLGIGQSVGQGVHDRGQAQPSEHGFQ